MYPKMNARKLLALGLGATAAVAMLPAATQAEMILNAGKTPNATITVDGNAAEWGGISGITVPLTGRGGVDSVQIKATVIGDTIYLLAVWKDSTKDIQHKNYQWDEASKSYKRTNNQEDRFAVSLAMDGNFSPNKIDGSTFKADVWHWKAARTDPAGLAQDKNWVISTKKVAKANKFKTPDGKVVYVSRRSDKGDKMYKSTKYDTRKQPTMPRYIVNLGAKGSIADVKAKGKWANGRWTLELARKLNTGNDDDAVIQASGTIGMAVAVFNHVSDDKHSVSDTITLKTGNDTITLKTGD